ncbi:NAD-dependent epimerase/dehydratase family protein [Actinoallomurus rhizosphaericola]|uniref:NAD-dependent epimerase/dehydratase family protein n=1 Tax=Actinoallomurus rhizosphaericola TaxID=2952536 RepID=UPI002093DBD3|nr:NAD-dependent epimerase/dehydratase family protein [Actinoallomurus rhizosphaericola]MCO5998420.1 GDP-mannose 4,6-dehydratase [Actinoallomurus rhizosphaericola]
MTYLVTGGAGFIGSHLVDALLARGDSVIALDNLATGSPANLGEAAKNAGFRFVHGSVLDDLVVDELMNQCDAVVHMAAAVGVRLVVDEPLRSLITNIRGSQIVIEAAHRYRRKVLMTSTSDIYGKNSSGPLRETADRILGPPSIVRWAYSTAKAVDEILANCYHRERDLATVVVRLFNTVGPRQSPAYGMVVPRLVRQAVRGEPLTVYGDGRQTRCFTHVSDVVDALLRLLDEPAAVGQTYNVGSSREISIRELAETIVTRTGSASALQFVPYDQAYESGFEDMQRKVPDTTKLRILTGWLPRRSLDDILTDAIAHARRELAARSGPAAPRAVAMRT